MFNVRFEIRHSRWRLNMAVVHFAIRSWITARQCRKDNEMHAMGKEWDRAPFRLSERNLSGTMCFSIVFIILWLLPLAPSCKFQHRRGVPLSFPPEQWWNNVVPNILRCHNKWITNKLIGVLGHTKWYAHSFIYLLTEHRLTQIVT